MSFVLYDVETTGLAKRFDQIVHFAALRTDSELRIIDRLQTSCRLMPHIIPSPEAVHVTRLVSVAKRITAFKIAGFSQFS